MGPEPVSGGFCCSLMSVLIFYLRYWRGVVPEAEGMQLRSGILQNSKCDTLNYWPQSSLFWYPYLVPCHFYIPSHQCQSVVLTFWLWAQLDSLWPLANGVWVEITEYQLQAQMLSGLTCFQLPSCASIMRRASPSSLGPRINTMSSACSAKPSLATPLAWSRPAQLTPTGSSNPQPTCWCFRNKCLLVYVSVIYVVVCYKAIACWYNSAVNWENASAGLSLGLLKVMWLNIFVVLLTWSHLKYTSFIPSATGISNLIPNFLPATFTSGTTSQPE